MEWPKSVGRAWVLGYPDTHFKLPGLLMLQMTLVRDVAGVASNLVAAGATRFARRIGIVALTMTTTVQEVCSPLLK